jgi:putative redox protein
MVEVNVLYQGGLRCEAVHGPSGVVLYTDAPKDNHGKGESFSPTDLVATALAGCILTTMGIAAQILGVNIEGAKASVVKEMVKEPVRRIGALKVAVVLPGAGVTEVQRAKLEQAGLQCPVHKSMHPDVAMPITFHWQA